MLCIFDLDGTVIDSSHRLGNGSLDDWRRLSTPDNIAKDKELPLANLMRQAIESPQHKVWICTSRILGDADLSWLDRHGLLIPNKDILSRTLAEDDIPAPIFKKQILHRKIREDHKENLLRPYSTITRFKRSTLSHEIWDDDPDVIDTLRLDGWKVSNATISNNSGQIGAIA